MDKIFEIIIFSINQINKYKNWKPFCELVCNKPLHVGQLEFLSNSYHKENAIHCGNGFGKTDIIAFKHLKFILEHFLYGSDYMTLNISITTELAQIVMERIIKTVKNAPLLNKWLIPENRGIVFFPNPKITYCNGAKTEFKTTKKKAEAVEGKEYGYISADEIALEPHIEFIRDKILLPRLRKYRDSQLDFSATPKGQNAYYRVVSDIKRKGGHTQKGSSYENPFIDHQLLDYARSTWSDMKIRQSIYGEFVDTSDMMFASRVSKLFNSDLKFEELDKAHKYLEAWDLARGRKGENADQTVGFRCDLSKKIPQITNRWAFQLPWTEKERENINNKFGSELERTSTEAEIRFYQNESKAKCLIDSTGIGDTLYGILSDIALPIDFRGHKDRMLDHAQAVIDAGKITAPFYPELADEMTTYQRDDKNLSTDNLMAFIILCSGIEIENKKYGSFLPKNPEKYRKIRY